MCAVGPGVSLQTTPSPFSLNLAETYKGGDPAEENVKYGELVGKGILP